jgi:hypothetical protein
MKLLPTLMFIFISLFVGACTAASPAGAQLKQTITLTDSTSAAVLPTQSNVAASLPPTAPGIATASPSSTFQATPAPTEIQPSPAVTALVQPTPTASQRVITPLGPDDWKELPVIPEMSKNVVRIYQRGLQLGNNPQAFSKIGDCGSTPAWFLGDFDRGVRFFSLGDHQNLNSVIQAFEGSYSRTSLAARSGFNASSIFSPLWSDPKQCQSNETPLACEYRVQRPSIAFIMLGSNDVYHPQEFEPQMRKIIEYSIDQGIVPILSTKPDNIEGDGSINATIARLALEYDIPLWNYWRALQGLPDNGLQEDKVHITWGPNHFDDPITMTRGWPVRNLTALQTLDAIWQAVASQKPTP